MKSRARPSLASDGAPTPGLTTTGVANAGVATIGVAAALARVRPLLKSRPLLLACDFDGTLSPLSADPWGATIIPSAQRALRRLAATPGVHVALISGRTVSDLASRTRIGGISYRGDHGAERAEATRGFRPAALHTVVEPARSADRQLVARLIGDVPRSVPESWLVVETKSAAVTFHFRGAPDVAAARRRILAAVDAIDPHGQLVRSGSRRALELRPSGASTKGDALRRLIAERRPGAAIMFGDDRNDALAFDVLRAARSAGHIDGLAIAVAGHADVTADVAPRADLMLEGPGATARLLKALASVAGSGA